MRKGAWEDSASDGPQKRDEERVLIHPAGLEEVIVRGGALEVVILGTDTHTHTHTSIFPGGAVVKDLSASTRDERV